MKALCTLVILMLANSTWFLTQCQSIYFNNLYHIGDPNTWSASRTVGEDESGYVILGKTGVNIGLIRLNYKGDQLWYKTWGDSIANWYFGWPGSLVTLDNNHYVAGSKNYYSPTNYDVGMVYKMDQNWDTLWTKEINMNLDDYADTSTLINQLTVCDNGNLALVGGIYESSIGSKILLIKTDTAGNIIWHNLYSVSTSDLNDGYSVIQTSDSGFAIGGYWYNPGPYSTGDPIIIKTDRSGNREWFKNLGGLYEDYAAMLCRSNDGNILMGTVIADTEVGHSPISRINVVKLDNDGNIIWNKKYGSSSLSNFLHNVRCLEDGSIICIGSVRAAIPWWAGWILKLNSDGDSIWYRQHYYFEGSDSYNEFEDIIQTGDSGFLVCGDLFPIPPDMGIQSAWGLKLDSIGCDFAGCDTTVGILEGHGGIEEWGLGGMEIWPNPARDWIALTLPDNLHSGIIELAIYNIFGQEVMKSGVSLQNRAVSLNVSNLPSGLYFAVSRDAKRKVFKGKFIVAR